MKYKKKPVVIEAVKVRVNDEGIEAWDDIHLPQWVLEKGFDETINNDWYPDKQQPTSWFIKTLEGNMQINNGDFIIKGVKGELYPCKPDIFALTYEEV